MAATQARSARQFRAMAAERAQARATLATLHRATAALRALDEAAGVADSVLWAAEPERDDALVERALAYREAEERRAARGGRSGPRASQSAESAGDDSDEYDPCAAAAPDSVHAEAATVEAHCKAGDNGSSGEEGGALPGSAAAAVWLSKTPPQRLDTVIAELRGRHCYCLFCGTAYADAERLAVRCPGPTEADHEL